VITALHAIGIAALAVIGIAVLVLVFGRWE
jgi:hypothetical protein